MTDLEITKLCAEAMGESVRFSPYGNFEIVGGCIQYDPLTNDAQAMALVKKFELCIGAHEYGDEDWVINAWDVDPWDRARKGCLAKSLDLNRAICEAVAKMQEAKAHSTPA